MMILISTTKKIFLTGIALVLNNSLASCQNKEATIHIDFSKTYQTISNFGASDAWSCQFAGNWPDDKRNKIADLLFSNDTYADGSPKGIGLSLWRFNIGAGSAQQGNGSEIQDEWRRAESFLNADGTYNWQNQSGQVWFLKAAKKRGVKQFLGFTNSPPVQYTINKKAYANDGKVNIAPDKYNAFAAYLAKVVQGLEQVSEIKFDYISPINEPQWDWSNGGQEGCPYNNTEIAGVIKSISKEFEAKKISSKILVGEAGSINYLFTPGDKPGRGNQINDFFRPGSANYLGDLPGVSKTISAHSYFTTSPMATAIKARKALADNIAAIKGLDYWQSEYCILGDNAGEMDGNERDLGIDAALYLASVIHTDLTVANASAWQWWTAISAYDYKDGLIYIDKNKTDGNFYSSKMLWAMGNYSRFIKPGAIRINAEVSSSENKPLLVSAFKSGKNIVVVIINPNPDDVVTGLNTGNTKIQFTNSYLTSRTGELKASKIDGSKTIIPSRSVITLTGLIR
ncbi:glycoside hydrolase [Mucilaginibacter lappiensis]|uniref:O-glycosyl hydrolase n=1 Tax=Mucilaginibacter lappiensis TaxID=354630 RepID=A0A1N6V2D1_9SPHI|nr:glycoside hydrolase [Mucilaginibacter lappiensis]MBB6109014.1 O-glycosyl hydrolase [Mucilaginibacter lappiensis]MBB6127390.1 O-glycosyl hydrolase [Mucilaginibacter lappiensis]SIQ71970.1 O-Glycosyl hydrolase [Mucilaginibacter lappiensis]